MFAKKHRLGKSRDFQTAFAKGRSFFNPHINLRFFSHPGPNRFAVAVSTKVYKRATARNRLKRILRELLKQRQKALRSGDFIIFTKPALAKLSETDQLGSLAALLEKLRV